jgi:hypothetical protein
MFFNRRRKLRDLAEMEAQGKSLWTTAFDPEVRAKLTFAMGEAAQGNPNLMSQVAARAAYLLRKDEGWYQLVLKGGNSTTDFVVFLGRADDQYLPSAIEAIYVAGSELAAAAAYPYALEPEFSVGAFTAEVNRILGEHRISFELIGGEMVPFQSKELHEAVVAPTLRLLAGSKTYSNVEAAYQDALRELAEGHPDDAVTDAARALQGTLLALGCDGNAIGPLLASAKKKKLLGSHDQAMADALENIIDWVSSDRATMGDAHVASPATAPDAWFSVHVIGAVILRLTQGTRK